MFKIRQVRKIFKSKLKYSQAFDEIYQKSIQQKELFWSEQAEKISWMKPFDKVFDDSNPPFFKWFTGGTLNTCYNALDRHVESGLGHKKALIYDSPVTNTIQWYTYKETLKKVQEIAGVLISKGVKKGDIVIIYMPMIPETIFAMLACARIGAIHSVVFGGFSSHELAVRINDSKPVMILTASCGIEPSRIINYKEIVDNAIKECSVEIKNVLVYQRKQLIVGLQEGRDYDWEKTVSITKPFMNFEELKSTDPLYIIYTSGTTGRPKGIVRDNGGHAVALNWSMKNIYGVEQDDVWWAASDVGWVVGHSYITYAPLIYGCTSIIFEGKPVGTPDPGVYWRVIKDHKVSTLFTAPTTLRAIKKDDPQGILMTKYNLSNLKRIFVAGERCDVNTLQWVQNTLEKPVYDHYWQTETGWPIIAPCVGIAPDVHIYPGSSNKPVPGYQCEIIKNIDSEEADSYQNENSKFGHLAIKLPLPPGTLMTVYNDDERYINSYLKEYPGYYLTGDAAYKDERGNIYIVSRTDDIINVAAHRLSTSSMEETLSSHPDVAECAVVGVNDQLKGQVPIGLIVLKSDVTTNHDIIMSDCINLIRNRIGALASFKKVVVVKRLPKTRSGKIVRNVIRHIANGEKYKTPATIDDPESVLEIHEALASIGYPIKPTTKK